MVELAPPGQFIDIGGINLHYSYQGDSAPTVILEAGWTVNHLSWNLVQAEIASFASVFSYDRAGMGWSDLSPNPRTKENIVSELHDLLEKAEIPASYILVGQSKGGTYMRYFAHCYPELVAGMVLVDSGHERGYQQFQALTGDFLINGFQKNLEMCRKLMNLSHEDLLAVIQVSQAATRPFPEHIQALLLDRVRPQYYQARVQEIELLLEQLKTDS